jgi:putative membrane-bound dehydrogenase-like protein
MRRLALLMACVSLTGAILRCSAIAGEPGQQQARAIQPTDWNPYHPHRDSPRLTTPSWVGEPGVEAVVVLAIDDMRDTAKYEAYLRPILNRLKAIDGRAALSIMTNQVPADDPRLQTWLREGVSIECHTLTHPCPFWTKGDFAAAARTYHDCVDLISQIPGNKPVAFRMPCCDSMNTVSPRFFSEIFARKSRGGHSLAIDSSVFTVLTPDDPALPRDLVFDADGKERFRKYIPFPGFVNTIENYPYPYRIGDSCWELPCIVPSDWEGQNLNKPRNHRTLDDMKAALDCVVAKQGVFNFVFHPHGWISSDQVVELIDYAVRIHGTKVKFLNFREARDRLTKNPRWTQLFAPRPPALPAGELPPGARFTDEKGRDAGLRLVDIDEDGYLDAVWSNDQDYGVYLYDPATPGWTRKVMAGSSADPAALPKIVRDGTDNGFFVHSRQLCWQNEQTVAQKTLVFVRSFNDLLKHVEPRGKSVAASLSSIRVAPGFKVELVASEPLVKDPIAFDWGADSKLWVVEMGDYPLGLDGRGKPGGVVRYLEDENADGIYDKQTTFLEGLGFPTGLLPWQSGVLVGCAPDIFYAEDKDGDGKADVREVLFTGFSEGNQQHRFNGFQLGLDGWVYGANGDSGGQVRSLKLGKSTSINGRDFRFRPDTGEFEAESGQTQYGRHRDDWGHWFGNNNPNWAWHYVLANHDLERNSSFAPPDPRQTLEPDTRLFPVSRMLARFNDLNMAGRVTSANSPTPYRDELFGPWFATSLFVSEPVHNLVHRIVLEPAGASFRGRRGPDESDREFLASSDNWFRPTMLKTGPDGALYIADMYRYVIEHPEWIPDDWEQKLDLRAGSEQGRIYRVYPVDATPRPIPRLDKLDTAGLVAALESPSGWQRDTAQRLLLHRRDPEAHALLRKLVRVTKHPKTRVQAIWTLADLQILDELSIVAGLEDPDPRVRESVIPAVSMMDRPTPELFIALIKLASDPDAHVRFQLALALGNFEGKLAGSTLASLAVHDRHDPWMRAAVMSSAAKHAGELLLTTLRAKAGGQVEAVPSADMLPPLLRLAVSRRDRVAFELIEKTIAKPEEQDGRYAPWQFASLAVLLEARDRVNVQPAVDFDAPFLAVWPAARAAVADEKADEGLRAAAASLVGYGASRGTVGRAAADRDLLLGLLSPRVSVGLQRAAVAALGKASDPKIGDSLVRDWKTHSPQVRDAILDALLSRPSWTGSLLSALEDGCVPPAEIDPARRQRLLTLRGSASLRARADAVFAHQTRPRQAVVDSFRPALAMKGDRSKGAAVFKKLCASCHRLGNEGIEVGPDLAALADKSPEALMIAVLDPNRAFETKYASFAVATRDGRVLNGMVSHESATAVTLRRQDGKEDVLLRSQIDEMTSSGQSLMPEGMEKDLQPRDLADLIAFLGSSGALKTPE